MGLATPATVQKLQAALHAKAKDTPDFRFYSLYDKVHRPDVLAFAYRCCEANKGCAGIDGQTFGDIEAYGPERWLGELMEALRNKTYRPQPLRRVYILKADGRSKRPLGIPTIRDRVAQTAAALVLGPIFEADLMPEQYAYRPERRALDAVKHVEKLIRHGHQQVVDADLSGYFDTIPHGDLMRSVARRTCDSSLLHLIKMWLEMPVVETDQSSGTSQTSTRNRDEQIGTPQGSPISPLLSNLYMRRFIRGWQLLGYQAHYGAQIVNYADDFVICCRRDAAGAMTRMRQLMVRLKLTVNERKTRLCILPDEKFDFLGYTFGRWYSPQTGQSYLGAGVSKKKVQKVLRTIHDLTTRRTYARDAREQVGKINRVLTGWSNYFCHGTKAKAYDTVKEYVRLRLHRWLCRKHKIGSTGWNRFTDQVVYQDLGLVRLGTRRRRRSCANA